VTKVPKMFKTRNKKTEREGERLLSYKQITDNR
jgi:hypothetical protein